MSSVLGVSVGAGAVRMARSHVGQPHGQLAPNSLDLQTIPVGEQRVEELAAEAISVTLSASPTIAATAIAYRSEQHAKGIRAAMARQQLTNYALVPEINAALAFAESTGDIRGISSLVVYDLGSSGLTVSVVDTQTREVRHSERTSDISGDYLDSLIREQQLASGRIGHPPDAAGLAALDALCRAAKEQLSTSTAVALPSEQGLVLIARENFDALATLAIESSARMARDVIVASGRPVHGVLAIGGGAQIPLVAAVLERWMGVPVVVPEHPETVVVRGAAMLARPVGRAGQQPPQSVDDLDGGALSPAWLSAPTKRNRKSKRATQRLSGLDAVPAADLASADELSGDGWSAPRKQRNKRELNGAVLTVTALAVVAAVGLGLGYGPQVLERNSRSSEGATSVTPTSSAPPSTPAAPKTSIAPPTSTVSEAVAAPRPQQDYAPPTTTDPPPVTFVVPGLPPIVMPTIPRDMFPLPPAEEPS